MVTSMVRHSLLKRFIAVTIGFLVHKKYEELGGCSEFVEHSCLAC
jgi:hypothetical protein